MILQVNSISIPLVPGEKIELTRSNAQVSRLGNRSGSFTNDFQVPMIPTTSAALGYSDLLESSDSITPETRQSASLFRETGGEIARGFVQIVKADLQNKVFTLTFFTGNTSWVDLLKGKSIRDVWLDDFNHLWTEANIAASWTNTDGYIYPWVDYGRLTYQNTTNTFIDDWLPAVFQKTLVERIFNDIGWIAKGSFIDSWDHKHTAIAFTNDKFSERNAPEIEAEAKRTSLEDYEIAETSGASAVNKTQTDVLDIDTIVKDELGNISLVTDRYTADRSLNNAVFVFTIPSGSTQISISSGAGCDASITLQINKNGTPVEEIILSSQSGNGLTTTGGDFVISTTQNLAPGDYIDCSVELAYTGATISTTLILIRLGVPEFYFALTSVDSEILPGGNVTLSNNLPDIDQADFIRDIIVRHGLLAVPDQYGQTVEFIPFDEVVNNEDRAQNLTDYVNLLSVQSIDFTRITGDYGKKNRFFYRKPSDDDEFITDYNNVERIEFGGGEFEVNNDFLEAIKEIYRSPFEPTYQIKAIETTLGWYVYLPYIPRISYDGSDTLRTGPRLLLVVQNTDINDFTNVFGTVSIDGTPYTETAFAYFTKPLLNSDLDSIDVSLAFDIPQVFPQSGVGLLDTFYPNWVNILNKPRFVELGVKLFSYQFEGLDLSLPVYIESEHIRGYFLIDEIVYRDGDDILRLIQLQ